MNLQRMQTTTDIIHGSIEFSGIEREILETPIFNRLHRILQSSLVFQTYSSNKVKRFEHSVGVMNLAGRMFFSSVCNTKDDVLVNFLTEVKKAIVEWKKDANSEHFATVFPRNSLVKYSQENILKMIVPQNPLYSQFFPRVLSKLSSEDHVAYYVAFQAIRIAGLLHDVGHMPYSHVLEHALKSLYKKVCLIQQNERTENHIEFLNIMSRYCDSSKTDKDEIHEEIGKLCAIKIFECIANKTEQSEENMFFIASYDFACQILQSKTSDDNIYSDLHRIVAGIVDADRLDYCSRDAVCAGTRSDKIDYKRLFSSYSICEVPHDKPLLEKTEEADNRKRKCFFFCPHVKNVSLIEDLLNRRWEIFSTINFHHRVHKHEILLEKIIVELGLEDLSHTDRIEDLQQGPLPLKVSSIWKLISLLKENDPPEYLLIQFDDSWLDTLLKCRFFERYGISFMFSKENSTDEIWNQYDELISSQKRYYSVLKRTENFRSVDFALFEKVREELSTDKCTIFGRNKDLALDLLTKIDYNTFLARYKSLFFHWLINNTMLESPFLPEDKIELFESIQGCLRQKLQLHGKIQDIIIRDCTFKRGCASVKHRLMVSTDSSVKIFQNFSNIDQVLKDKRNLSLPFHLYYLPRNDLPQLNAVTVDCEADINPYLVEAIWEAINSKTETI